MVVVVVVVVVVLVLEVLRANFFCESFLVGMSRTIMSPHAVYRWRIPAYWVQSKFNNRPCLLFLLWFYSLVVRFIVGINLLDKNLFHRWFYLGSSLALFVYAHPYSRSCSRCCCYGFTVPLIYCCIDGYILWKQYRMHREDAPGERKKTVSIYKCNRFPNECRP